MPNTIKPFHAARLVDEKCQVAIPFYLVDTESHDSLMESVEAITKSSRTPEEVKEMLGVVKAKAAELFTEEEIASLFNDAVESDGTPLSIMIEAEGNYPLIFEALDQLTASVPEVSKTQDEKIAELEAKIKETEDALATAVAAEGESTTKMAQAEMKVTELEAEIEKLKAESQDPELIATLKGEIETLKTEAATDKETIEVLRKEMADFEALKHDTLVKEAARLAMESKRSIAKGKSFDELCEALAARTDESLSDMISDCKAELETASEEEKPAGDSEQSEKTEPAVEKVEDPTLPVGDPGIMPDVEEVADQLHATITEDADSIETYMVMGLTEAELIEIYGEDIINKLKESK